MTSPSQRPEREPVSQRFLRALRREPRRFEAPEVYGREAIGRILAQASRVGVEPDQGGSVGKQA